MGTVETYTSFMGVARVWMDGRLKSYTLGSKGLDMVEVECPSCSETVDLGSDTTGTYECPYCNEDFEYDSEIERQDGDLSTIWIVGAVSLAFGVAGVIALISVIEDMGWEETDAEITYREESFGTSARNGDFDYEYTFMVNGESYNGTDQCRKMEEGGYSCEKVYEVGDQVRISYNPDNPNESEFVDNQFPMFMLCCLFIPVILLGLAVYGRITSGRWEYSDLGSG